MERKILYMLGSSPMTAYSGHLRHRELLDRLSVRYDVRVHVFGTSDQRSRSAPSLGAGRWVDQLTESSSGQRFGLARVGGRASRRYAATLIEQWEPDVVVVDTPVGALLRGRLPVPVIVDFCDARSAHHARRLRIEKTARGALRLARSVLLERAAARSANAAIFISERDRSDSRVRSRLSTTAIVRNGVDTEYWAPSVLRNGTEASVRRPQSLIFTGRMDYPPNVDAAVQLCRTVLPRVVDRIPGTRVVIAGADPAPEVRALASDADDIVVTGTVDDLRPHLDEASLFVAPLRFGAGTQNKILEALAMDLPVVTTPLACAGLTISDGEFPPPPICAHDVGEMADVIVTLLTGRDAGLPCAGRGGRRWVTDNFNWDAAAQQLSALVEDLA